jgi:hypothetical protein
MSFSKLFCTIYISTLITFPPQLLDPKEMPENKGSISGGRPAYRLLIHHKRTTTAKGFLYVADSNGQVFMLLGTALWRPEELQSALERISFTNATP